MDSDFSEKLKSVLSDPEAMAKITAIASGLGTSGNAPSGSTPTEQEPATLDSASSIGDALPALTQSLSPQSDPRIALLYSLKPLLREDKRDKIDSLTKALTIASLMKQFRK